MFSFPLFLFKDLLVFIGKAELKRRGEKDRKILHPLVHSAGGRSGWS